MDDKNSKLKPWMKITISIFVLLVTFVLGMAIGSLLQNVISRNDEIDYPDYECATCDNGPYDNIDQTPEMADDFIRLESYSELAEDETYVFKNYEDYFSKMDERSDRNLLTKEDFDENQYGLITIGDESCGNSIITPFETTTSGNKVTARVFIDGGCGVCALTYYNYLVKIDKTIKNPTLKIEEEYDSSKDCDPYSIDKPMIYLYPTEETEVSVQLGKTELLTTTYPKYNNGWNVLAEPDGTLYDNSGREFYGLYWEGSEKYTEVKDEGFVVSSEDSAKFLEEKLAILGLTEREANEFIVYWLPKLESSPYNYIRFETKDEIENYMPLTVSPKPDSIIRIIMDYKPLSEPISVSEQQLETPTRSGFTVVEWGGTRIGENKIY